MLLLRLGLLLLPSLDTLLPMAKKTPDKTDLQLCYQLT